MELREQDINYFAILGFGWPLQIFELSNFWYLGTLESWVFANTFPMANTYVIYKLVGRASIKNHKIPPKILFSQIGIFSLFHQ